MNYLVPAQAGAQLITLVIFITLARWYVAPWLARRERADALIVGTALAVRVFGIVADGTLAESLRVLIAETVLLGLALAAYAGERLASASSASRRA